LSKNSPRLSLYGKTSDVIHSWAMNNHTGPKIVCDFPFVVKSEWPMKTDEFDILGIPVFDPNLEAAS